MKKRLYRHLPPLEHRPDGSLYRMTPAQRKWANSLIRRECCSCDGGNCLVLDDGDTCTCPQMIIRLLQVVPLGSFAAGRDAGSGDLP